MREMDVKECSLVLMKTKTNLDFAFNRETERINVPGFKKHTNRLVIFKGQ